MCLHKGIQEVEVSIGCLRGNKVLQSLKFPVICGEEQAVQSI